MVFKWREEYIDKLLDEYRKQEYLWNISNDSYKNRNTRDKAFESICFALNLPGLSVNDIKIKIKTIRTNYKCELNKILKSEKSGAELSDVYVPRLFWFKKADEYLRGVSVAKNSISNLSAEVESPDQPNTSDSIHNIIDEEQLSDKDEIEVEMTTFENKNFAGQRKSNTTLRKSTNNKRNYSQISAIENSINKLQTISNSYKDDDDEFDLFAKSIAVQLKKMPLDRAFICQEKIMHVMKQERLNQLTVTNRQPQPYYDTQLSSPDLFSDEQSTSSWPYNATNSVCTNTAVNEAQSSPDLFSDEQSTSSWPYNATNSVCTNTAVNEAQTEISDILSTEIYN